MKANKTITSTFFKSEDGYNQIQCVWSEWLQESKPTFTDHLVYSMLRGTGWQSNITPLRNINKLSNEHRMKNWYKITNSFWGKYIIPDRFKDLLVDDVVDKLETYYGSFCVTILNKIIELQYWG